MSKLTVFAKVLKRLDSTSQNIINASLAIMKKIQNVDSELVDDLIEEKGGDSETADREALLNALQEASLDWTGDAEKVRQELDNFVLEEDDIYTVNADMDTCPFLTEVWNGDSYDKTGVEGLQALLTDLENQLKDINEESLVRKAAGKV